MKRMSKRLTVSLLLNVCPRIPPLDPITKASDLDPAFECEMLKKVVRLHKIISLKRLQLNDIIYAHVGTFKEKVAKSFTLLIAISFGIWNTG